MVRDEGLTLHEAAAELGVHYMTAYRYVRLGQLDAVKRSGTWRVSRAELDRFRAEPAESPPSAPPWPADGSTGARNAVASGGW